MTTSRFGSEVLAPALAMRLHVFIVESLPDGDVRQSLFVPLDGGPSHLAFVMNGATYHRAYRSTMNAHGALGNGFGGVRPEPRPTDGPRLVIPMQRRPEPITGENQEPSSSVAHDDWIIDLA